MKNLLTICLFMAASFMVKAQSKQEVFSSIQKLLDKTSGEKVASNDVFSKKDDKLGKQVFTEKEVTVKTIPGGKSKYEWINRATEIMWNEFFDYLIYTEFKNSNLQIVKLNFKKRCKTEYFANDEKGDTNPSTSSSFQFYVLTSDKKELEQLLTRLYDLKEKKTDSPFNKEIEKFNKQQTITWLKEKLLNNIAGDDYTTSIKLISLDDCNLVYEHTNLVGRKYQETMPTSIESISKYNRLTYSKKSCISKSFAFEIIQEKDEITYKDFSFLSIKSKDADLISNIEFAIKHLAKFCNSPSYGQSYKNDTNENKNTATQETAQEKKEYYENGQLKSVGNFANGKANGEWKFYHENGQLAAIGKYINGKANGEWKEYYNNGQLKSIGNNTDEIRNGEWKFYHENGKLENFGKYTNDKANGDWKFYYDNGQFKATGNYTNSIQNGVWKFYHENGQLSSIGNLTNGTRNGEWKTYYENGQLNEIGNVTNGTRNGEWKAYHKNGQLNEIGNFTNDKQTGEWKKFNENGELTGKKLFDDEGKETEIKNINTKIDEEIDDSFTADLFKVSPDLDKGIEMLEKKDYKNSIIEFDKFIKINSDPKDGYFYRGKAKYNMKKYEEAITDFNTYFSTEDSMYTGMFIAIDAYFYRGCAKIEINQKDSGCLDLYKARDLVLDKTKAQDKINEYCK